MRKSLWSVVFALLALAAAGVAVAEEGDSRSTKAVSATFSAESGEHTIRTCLGADGRYRRVSGVWEGESKSAEDALAGELMIKGTAWIHVPSGNGSFEGRLRVGGEDGVHASLHAVLKEGKLEGFAVGKAGKRELQFLANVSAAFGAEEITEGKLGGGGGANTAVFVKGSCPPRKGEAKNEERKKEEAKNEERKKEEENKAERKQREFAGVVSAVSHESVTLKVGEESVTCEVTAAAAGYLEGVSTGAKVAVLCVLEDGHWHLLKLKKLEDGSKAERKSRELEGVISAVGEGSITVSAEGKDALSCSFGERMTAELRTAGYVVGTKVYAACVDEGKGYVLVKIKKL